MQTRGTRPLGFAGADVRVLQWEATNPEPLGINTGYLALGN
jgi:hypothetical protein